MKYKAPGNPKPQIYCLHFSKAEFKQAILTINEIILKIVLRRISMPIPQYVQGVKVLKSPGVDFIKQFTPNA